MRCCRASSGSGKPNEFGKMVKLQEAENQIVIDYDVHARQPSDSDLSSRNEAAVKQMGVKRVCICIPNRASESPDRKREQKKRWVRNGQKWRPDARDAWSSGGTASTAVGTRARPE
jgi:IS5 family transposase